MSGVKRGFLFAGIVGCAGLAVVLGLPASREGVERLAAAPEPAPVADDIADASPPKGRLAVEPMAVRSEEQEPVLAGLELRVRVQDRRGLPVGFVPVGLKLVPEQGKALFRYGLSDESGLIRFTDLPPGEATIRGDALGSLARDSLELVLEASAEIVVEASGLLRYAGRFEPPPGPGLDVVLSESFWPEELEIRDELRRTRLGEEGTFDFRGLAPGPYRLALERPGAEYAGGLVFAHDFELARSEERGVLRLPERLSLAGRVEASEDLGALSLYLFQRSEEGKLWRYAYSARDFRLDDLLPGRYELLVWSSLRGNRFAGRGRRTVYFGSLDLAASQNDLVIPVADPVTVWVHVGAPEAGSSTGGAFVLEDASGQRLEEQEFLWTFGKKDALWPTRYSTICDDTRIDDGYVELLGVRPGDWTLHATLEGMIPIARSFHAEEGLRLDLRFERRTGRVVRAAIQGAYEVDVCSGARADEWSRVLWGTGVRVCDAKTPGLFTAFFEPGKYRVRIRGKDFVGTVLDPLVVADDPAPLVLGNDLSAGHRLRGRVVTADGVELRKGTIHVLQREDAGAWAPMPWKTAVLQGNPATFEVSGLGPGTYRFAFDTEGTVLLGEVTLADADVERTFMVDS
jgi:hypothetical protein